MDSKEKEELLEIWTKFLNTTFSEDGDIWLGAFLAKFLHLASKEPNEKQLALIWKNASNSLAHHLMFDVHHICRNVASSADDEEETQGSEDAAASTLQKYLLQGRGWKLLWCLELLGIENLSCAKDLVELLISHIPVVISFPVNSSTAPEHILKKLCVKDCSTFFIPKKNISCLKRIDSEQLMVFAKNKNKRFTGYKGNKVLLRKRLQKQKERSANCGGSSSENEVHIRLISRQNTQEPHQKMLMKMKCFDNLSLQTVYPSETDEPDGSDFLYANVLSSDQIVSDFEQYSLSTPDYISFVLHFLEKITKLDQKVSTWFSVCCPLIMDFSISTLRHIQCGEYKLHDWSEQQVKNMRNRLLKLLFSAFFALRNVPGKITETVTLSILEVIMPLSSAIFTVKPGCDDLSAEDVAFVCDTALGVLYVINVTVKLCAGDHTQIIRLIRTFTHLEGIENFCKFISCFEKTSSLSCYSSNVVYLIKSLVILLKSWRTRHAYHELSQNCGVEPRNMNDFCHHHHSDMFGSGYSHTISQNVPMCAVATMSHLLLKVYNSTNSLKKVVLKSIRECGICCCLDPDFVLSIMFSGFEEHSSDLQQLVLALLEKTVYPQLGITSESCDWCHFCEKRKDDFRSSPNVVSNFSVEHMQTLSEAVGDCPDSGNVYSAWRSLELFTDILRSSSVHIVTLATKHISYLLVHGANYIKSELFIRTVLPDMLKLVFELRSKRCLSEIEQVRIDSYLSLLPLLLSSGSELETFVHFGGIRVLYELLFFPDLRLSALNALEVLITIEIEKHASENTDISKLYSSDPFVSNSSTAMMTFSDILCQCSKSFLQKLRAPDCFSYQELTVQQDSLASQKRTGNDCCSHSTGFKSLLIDRGSKIDSSSDGLLSSLMFLGDLWAVCKSIVLKVPSGTSYLCTHAMWDSCSLFTSLLRSLDRFLEPGNRQNYDRVLYLIEHLLTVFLHFKDYLPNVAQRLPSKEAILKSVKTCIQDCKFVFASDLQLLLDSLLQCCIFCITVDDSSNFPVKKNVLPHTPFFSSWENSATSSDRSDPDAEFLNSSYDGDSERSDSENTEPSGYVLPQKCQKIRHAEVVKLVLEILLHFFHKIEMSQWVPVAVHIMQAIIRLCHDCESNVIMLSKENLITSKNHIQLFLSSQPLDERMSAIQEFSKYNTACQSIVFSLPANPLQIRSFHLHKTVWGQIQNYTQGVCSYILHGFFEIMKTANIELEALQKVVMELFGVIAQFSLSAEDLKKFIDLFKSPTAPFDILVNTLKTLTESALLWPAHTLAFPCTQTRLKLGKSENKQKLRLSLQLYDVYHQRKIDETPLNSWGCAAAIFPLTHDSKLSSLRKSFSVAMWVCVKKPGKEAIIPVKRDVPRNLSKCVLDTEDGTFHVISVGSDTVMLETWINTVEGDIIFRIIMHENEDVFCLASESCQGLLKPGTWHYVTYSYSESSETNTIGKKLLSAKIHLLVDGIEERTIELSCENPLLKNNSVYFILLGHSVRQNKKEISSAYYLGSFMLFKGEVLSKDIAFYMSSLGPGMTNISKCALESQKMFFPHKVDAKSMFSTELSHSLLGGLTVPSLELLQKNLLLLYSAENHMMYALYPQSAGILFPLLAPFAASGNLGIVSLNDWPAQQEPGYFKLVVTSHLSHTQVANIYTAMHHIGGISVFLLLFARVIEFCENEETQALALQIFLHVVTEDYESAGHFLKINGDKILLGLLTSNKVVFSQHMLKVFLDCCLSDPVLKFTSWKGHWSIDYKSEAIICRPFLWDLLVKCIFFSKNCPEVVQVTFMNITKLLLRQNHAHASFNLEQMRLVSMLETLLSVLKHRYVLRDSHLPVEVAVCFPQVIKNLLSHCKDMGQLWLICNLLLLLHQASDTYVCHARSSFFYLLEQQLSAGSLQRRFRKHSLSDIDQGATFSSTESAHDSSVKKSGKKHHRLSASRSLTDLTCSRTGKFGLKRALSSFDVQISDEDKSSGLWLSSYAHGEQLISEQRYDNRNLKNMDTALLYGQEFTRKGPVFRTESDSLQDSPVEELYLNLLSKKKKGVDSHSALSELPPQTSFSVDYVEMYVGLLSVVNDVVSHSDSETKKLVLEVIKPEVFIVLAYNRNHRICSAALEVIHSYLQQSSAGKIGDFLSLQGFHLIANQLHQLPVDPAIVGSCFNFMFFGKHTIEDCWGDMSPGFGYRLIVSSWVPLLSVLSNLTEDVGACNSVLSALSHQITEVPDAISDMMNNGLGESLALCLTKSIHSSQSVSKSVTSLEKNRILRSTFHILRLISSNLFSSKRADDFASLTSLLQLFFQLEVECDKQCGSSAICVSSYRDCQCVIFQAAIDFIDVYNYRRVKDNRSEIGRGSVWEILISMPDNLNPYSTFLSSSNSSISSDSHNSDFGVSHSFNTLQNAEKANKELPMSVAVDRFRFILSIATDFVVFQDPNCIGTDKQNCFFRSLFHSLIRGLSTMMEKNASSGRSKWSAVIWSVKDTLRLQVSRLLVYSLAQSRDVEQKCFVLETLADQRKCTEILVTVLFTVAKAETVPIFLYNLYNHRNVFTQKQRNDFHMVFSFLKQHLHSVDFSKFGDKEFILQFVNEWQQLWLQDRQKWLKKQLSMERKIGKKLESLTEGVSNIAMEVTKKVVSLQSVERKKFMEEVKAKNREEVTACELWHSLIEQFTHERGIWHIKECYPLSWEQDPTEGPQRIRKRLRRCYLNVEPRFVMEGFRKNLEPKDVALPFVSLLDYGTEIPDSSLVLSKLHVNEKIEYTCPCRVIMPLEEVKGELLIGDSFLHFIEDTKHQKKQKIMSERWPFTYIKEILPRRFELCNNAFEIFMKNGLTFLISFFSTKDLDEVWKHLQHHGLPCIDDVDISSVTQLWLDRSLTNFEYLTHLNKFAGRSFNDLMQYPVFPFILADFSSSSIDLNDTSTYRNLAKPIAIQNKEREEYYIKSYNALKEEQPFGLWSNSEHIASGPFHYGSHYSNSGIVLHFLVRLLPYTYGLIQYQDNNFDIPDRTFHSINTSWNLVTKNSPSDVRELVPEFYFLPEFLCNREGFDFGVRQDRNGEPGERVNDVELPPWCNGDPRLFILVQRQALESNYVTNNLKHWIDLVFGYKQTGTAAVNAINVFHPATYFGTDISKVADDLTREALKATIKTVGQMPRQLFHEPHPNVPFSLSDKEEQHIGRMKVLETVDGLKWGDYVGSPSTGTPNLVWRYKQSSSVGRLLSLFTNDVFGLHQNVSLLLNHSKEKSTSMLSATYIRSAALISWSHEDGVVRIKFCRDHPPVPLLKSSSIDPICLCASDPDCSELFVAHTSGIITVYSFSIDSAKFTVTEDRPPVQLNGHSGAIKSICISKAFSIVVTASEDKTCIIWDLNKLCYVRTIHSHTSAVKLVCVSSTLGDIASVSDLDKGSCLKAHTINGDLIGSVQTSHRITAICYSAASEGISVNVIATGTSTGLIRLWSSWNLKLVREIRSEKFVKPVTCITFSVDNQHLYAANTDGTVAVWEKPSKLLMSIPRFLMFT